MKIKAYLLQIKQCLKAICKSEDITKEELKYLRKTYKSVKNNGFDIGLVKRT